MEKTDNLESVDKNNITEENSGKANKIIFGFFLTIIIIIGVIYIGAQLFFRFPVRDYYKASDKAFLIPGLIDDFVPQGLDYDDRTQQFFVTGYYDEKPCKIFMINSEGRVTGEVELRNGDGSAFVSHAGGISVHGDYVYIAGGFDNCLYVFNYNEVIDAADSGEVNCKGLFKLESENDYLTVACMGVADDGIYIAEFYREENYPTALSHHITTSAGDKNNAFALKYKYSDDADSEFGLETTPDAVLSIPDRTQGILVDGDDIYISDSYGVAKSHIYKYDLSKADRGNSISVLDREVSLLELDSGSIVSDKQIAPMSEEIIVHDGKLYTMCESASNKYFFGKLTGGDYCYATDIHFFDK